MPGGPEGGLGPNFSLDSPQATPNWIQLQWGVSGEVACRAIRMAELFRQYAGRDLTIISGYRSREEQIALRERGRPAADPDLSNHTTCPARALDFYVPGGALSNTLKLAFGRAAQEAGFRWGGGSPLNDVGIPSDWNHVDLGPRNR